MVWSIISVTPGFEQRIKNSIETSHELINLNKRIFIPAIQKKGFINGKMHYFLEKLYPGYVFVECQEENYDKVFSFLSGLAYVLNMSSIKEINRVSYPIEDEEMIKIINLMNGEKSQTSKRSEHNFKINDKIKIISGPFSNFDGIIKDINNSKEGETKIKIATRLFNDELTFLIVNEMQIESSKGV